MGSRGAFENVDLGNFHFKEGGQNYHSVGEVDGIQVDVYKRQGQIWFYDF